MSSEVERNQIETGATAAPPQNVSDSDNGHETVAKYNSYTKDQIRTEGEMRSSVATVDIDSDIMPIYNSMSTWDKIVLTDDLTWDCHELPNMDPQMKTMKTM